MLKTPSEGTVLKRPGGRRWAGGPAASAVKDSWNGEAGPEKHRGMEEEGEEEEESRLGHEIQRTEDSRYLW